MTAPLTVTQDRLGMHLKTISGILVNLLEDGAEVALDADWEVVPLVAGLLGSGCEYIERNRGPRAAVAPLLRLGQGLWAWLGYREEWDAERSRGSIRRFSFRSVSISIHFGLKQDVFKPQMFRAEWAGWAKWAGADFGFQAANAAHPHWQFDVLESLPDAGAEETAALIRELETAEPDMSVREFGLTIDNSQVRDLITSQKLSRIHFASAASWWKSPPQNEHAHGPSVERDIETWVRASLDYLKVEMNRLL